MGRDTADARVSAEVAALAEVPREALAVQWEKRFGAPPPRGCGRALLELAAAQVLHEKAFGGESAAFRKALAAFGEGTGAGVRPEERGRSKSASLPPPRRALKPGARLVREWNGRTYHVEVVAEGFVWNGKTHRSLSAIAREITGVQWSGPRFFGL